MLQTKVPRKDLNVEVVWTLTSIPHGNGLKLAN